VSTGLCVRRRPRTTRAAPIQSGLQQRQAVAGVVSIYPYGRLYVLTSIHECNAARCARSVANRRRASKYAACRYVHTIARRARKRATRMLDRNHARIAFVVACARHDARSERKCAPLVPGLPRKKISSRRRIDALERTICAKLRNFRGRTNASRASELDARDGSFGEFFRVLAAAENRRDRSSVLFAFDQLGVGIRIE